MTRRIWASMRPHRRLVAGSAGSVLLFQGFEEGGRCKPEGARGRHALQAFDAGNGFPHLLRSGGILGIAEPLEETPFKAPPQRTQSLRVLSGIRGAGEGRAERQVGEEQLARGRGFLSAGFGKLGVEVEQLEGLIWLAAGQLVKIVADGGDAAGSQPGHFRGEGHLAAGHFTEQAIELLRELGQSVQPHNGEGAVGLVQVGLGELDPTQAVRD
jgi:hypothetical protein